MRCSASGMFATANVNSCNAVFRKGIYSLLTRTGVSCNIIIANIVCGDVHCACVGFHNCITYKLCFLPSFLTYL